MDPVGGAQHGCIAPIHIKLIVPRRWNKRFSNP